MKNFFTNLWVHIVFVFAFAFLVVFRINGFCANSLSIAPSAIPTFEAFSSGMASGGFAWGDPVIMTTEALNNINTNLYQLYGYDLNDLVNDSWNSLTTPSEWSNRLTEFVTGNATIDGTTINTSIADKIAQRISQGALTGAVTAQNLLDAGFAYFSTAVPQWGENAKQFFIGKRDAITGAITDVAPTMVTKITAQGLAAYNQVYNNLVNSGDIINSSISGLFLVRNFTDTYRTSTNSSGIKPLYISFSDSVFIYTDDFTTSPSRHLTHVVCPSNKLITYNNNLYLPCNGLTQQGTIAFLSVFSSSTFTINDVEYIDFTFSCCDSSYINISGGLAIGSQKIISSLNNIKSYITSIGVDVSSKSLSFDYSSSSLSQALKDQLDRLIGKYVDSLTLGRINDLVQSIPIENELVGEADVPVAIPTQEVVDELTGVIDDALELDEAYALAFDDAYAEPIDTTADPSPDFPQFPSGVPEEYVPPFLLDLFPTDMFSIFEPIFDIVGDEYSMFDTWLLIPAIFIFLFIFYVIISVL